MSETFHYIGDIGTVIELETGEDLTSATVTEIHIEKPDDSTVILSGAAIAGESGNSKIQATLFDLVLSGTYTVQAYVELPTPWKGFGKSATFRVYKKYATPT